jgi:hypothetical protein
MIICYFMNGSDLLFLHGAIVYEWWLRDVHTCDAVAHMLLFTNRDE